MKLVEYKQHLERHIIHYNLTDEQLRYTGTPKECIELSAIDNDRHSILAIENDVLVTFFVLHKNNGVAPYSKNPNAILLRSFSTDTHYQGNGYAKQSLILLPQFIKSVFPHINMIVLAVNVKNHAAQSLYKKCGYIDEGIRKMGTKGELVIMNYYI